MSKDTKTMPAGRSHRSAEGLAARDAAVSALFAVFTNNRAFDDAFDGASDSRGLVARDRAFARLIATTVLRHRGALEGVLRSYLEKPLPERQGRLPEILLAAAAQLLLLGSPPHAVISVAVDQCRADRMANRFAGLVNAVLRRVSETGATRLAALDNVALTLPSWLLARWSAQYGAAAAREIAQSSLAEPALDLTAKGDAERWAQELGGIVLPTGTVRLAGGGRVEALAGFEEGAWWVQDAAAALPARLLGDVRGLDVLDLCAAPGGKTAQLASAGARVVALDKSPARLKRLKANLERLGLEADIITADAASFQSEKLFDAVLLDAPCTSTGTIRRHPDIIYLKRESDVAALADLQAKLLANAARLLKPNGTLVYCTCSLEAEEGEAQIAAFLEGNKNFARKSVDPNVLGVPPDWVTPLGELRTLPSHLRELPEGMRGLDGFYAASLTRLR
jgi:16S rRNA (cytosine967-C5)-methyltransferase